MKRVITVGLFSLSTIAGVNFGGTATLQVRVWDPVDFIRLIAIGYDEICWSENFSRPPNQNDGFVVHRHTRFQDWVSHTFHVTIPATAREIVKHPSLMGDADPQDEFARWVNHHTR